jgi:hypothetical protein
MQSELHGGGLGQFCLYGAERQAKGGGGGLQARMNVKQTCANAAAKVRDAGVRQRSGFDLRFDERVGCVERVFESLCILQPQ